MRGWHGRWHIARSFKTFFLLTYWCHDHCSLDTLIYASCTQSFHLPC